MYENNDPNTENNESSTYRYTPERGTQSDYTAGAHNADSQYSSGSQSGCIPGSYSYSPEPPKKKKKLSAGKIIAIALACALLGGCLGVGATLLLRNNTENQTPSTGTTMYVGERQTEKVNTARTNTSEKLTPREVYAQNVNSTVGITTSITTNYWGYQTTSAASGSGFILTEDGYILTNYHVIEEAYSNGYDVSVLTHDGTEYAAEVVGIEKENDIAVLKIDAVGLNAVTLGDSNEMKVGQTIYTVGNPLGELDYTMTTGIVSAMDRTIRTDANTSVNMFQIDAAVNSGNSGGPIYNVYGQVIGIVTAKYSSTGVEGLGFGIPIADAHYIANELITNGYVSGKAYMGITVGTVSASAAQYYNMVEGAMVQSVTADSCADKAGLQAGDIITAVGETEVTSQSELISAIRKYHAGDTAQLTVFRAQEYLTLTITFDEALPAEESESAGTEDGSYSASGEMGPGEYYEYRGNVDPDDLEDFFNEFFNRS